MTSVHPEPQTPPQDGQQAPVEGNNQPPQQNIQQAAYGSSNQPQQYGQQIPYVAPNQYPQGQYGQQMPYGFQPQMQPMGPYMGQPTAFGGMGQLPGCGAPGYGMPWLPPPTTSPPAGCPPGLAPLLELDQLFIKQQPKLVLLEALTGFESSNKYSVFTTQGQIFIALEDTGDDTSISLCNQSSFTINIVDALGKHIMQFDAPFRCDSFLCPCYLKKVEVAAPPGNVISNVEQVWSMSKTIFKITTSGSETVLRIEGPLFPAWDFCGDRNFKLYTADSDTPCGEITHEWPGYECELIQDGDSFGVKFPRDLDVTVKAAMIGACFLIDLLYFEENNKNTEEDED